MAVLKRGADQSRCLLLATNGHCNNVAGCLLLTHSRHGRSAVIFGGQVGIQGRALPFREYLIHELLKVSVILVVAIADTMRKVEEKAAKGRQGTRTDKLPGKLPGSSSDTRDKLATYVGTSGKTLDKMTELVRAGEAEPEKYGKLVEDMDRTGNVNGPYKRWWWRKQRAPHHTPSNIELNVTSPKWVMWGLIS